MYGRNYTLIKLKILNIMLLRYCCSDTGARLTFQTDHLTLGDTDRMEWIKRRYGKKYCKAEENIKKITMGGGKRPYMLLLRDLLTDT